MQRKASLASVKQAALSRRIARGVARGIVAVGCLLAAFAVCFFAVAASLHSRVGFPAAIALAYTVGIAAFVLAPGRGSKGYNPFGPVVRAAFWPWLRVHAVCVAVLLCGMELRPWVQAHASPWWLVESGSRHSTWLGTAEWILFLALVIVEGIFATNLLADAEMATLQARSLRKRGV